MAPGTKASQKFNNLDLPLQHIRSVIEGRYVLYQECVTAITRAAERRQDASAWFEQLEQLVIGIDTVAFSHAGLVFLLWELMRGEGDFAFACNSLFVHWTHFKQLRRQVRCLLLHFLSAPHHSARINCPRRWRPNATHSHPRRHLLPQTLSQTPPTTPSSSPTLASNLKSTTSGNTQQAATSTSRAQALLALTTTPAIIRQTTSSRATTPPMTICKSTSSIVSAPLRVSRNCLRRSGGIN
jgi:hypothetical protein